MRCIRLVCIEMCLLRFAGAAAISNAPPLAWKRVRMRVNYNCSLAVQRALCLSIYMCIYISESTGVLSIREYGSTL